MPVTEASGQHELTLTITVTSGSGSADFNVSVVEIDTIAFDVPGTATFNYSIVDRNSRGVTAY